MKKLALFICFVMLVERFWKYLMVVRYFQRPVPAPLKDPPFISVIQPVLSGDPTMSLCLENSLKLKSRYALEFIWITDVNDTVGQHICQELINRYPEQQVQLIALPPPQEGQNPKTVKLIAGSKLASGQVLCVLDDDTMLPDNGLERCVPFLDQPEVGLAFGLPYYVNFSDPWSTMVSTFVNSNSLLTYIPYTMLTQPFTINGMFYALRREVLENVGGFEAIESVFADDFAVAHLLRSNGYRLAQTPLLHAISTSIKGPGHYISLIQRWFVLPRESLLRHLNWYDRSIIYLLGLMPALFPLLLIISLIIRPSRLRFAYTFLYFASNFSIFARLNKNYLRNATPWTKSWWVPIVQIVFPIQLLIALLSPQRINWRGNIVQIERGGGFRYVRHRE